MGRSLSKQKGAQFERDVCRILSLWVSKGKKKNLFWRSAMSGGRATLHLKRGETNKEQCGDIVAIHPDGVILTDTFYIECKFRADFNFRNILKIGEGHVLATYWKNVRAEAKKYRKMPMCIFKENRFPAIVLFPYEYPPPPAMFRVEVPGLFWIIRLEDIYNVPLGGNDG